MRFVLILLTLFLSQFAYTQTVVDSLMERLPSVSGSEKIEVLNNLAVQFKKTDSDKSIEYAQEALAIATKIDDKAGEAEAYCNIGIACYYKNDYEKALKNYGSSLTLREELNDSVSVAKMQYNIGMIYHRQSNFEKAVENYQIALKFEEAIGNKVNVAQLLNSLGIINMSWEKNDVALESYERALKIYQELDNKPGIANVLLNIGLNCFKSVKLGDEAERVDILPEEQARRDSVYRRAIKYYEEALAVSRELNHPYGISLALNNIGVVYKNMQDYDKAIEYTMQSLEVSEKIGDKRSMAYAYGSLGILFMKEEKYTEALESNLKSIELGKALNDNDIVQEGYKAYRDIYVKLGRYEEAFYNYRHYVMLKDSLFSAETQKQFAEMQTKYDTEKKEQEIKQNEEKIEQQNTLIFVFIIVSIVILTFLVLLIRLVNAKKKANKQLELKNEEILQQNEEILQQQEEILTQAEQLRLVNVELEKLSIVASETDNSVIIAEADGKMEWINAGFTRLLGYNLNEYIDAFGDNFIENSSNPNIREAIAESIESMRSAVYTAPSTTKDGKEIWLQTTLTPIVDMDGNLLKLVAIDSDITKLKDAETEIMKQHDLILEQRQEIVDSIHYAKRIQTAILPQEHNIKNVFDDYFIMYRPRDIVSGDFYWFASNGNKVVIAAADCTGHGVPGAFMSMLGVSFLNEIVNKRSANSTEANSDNISSGLKANEILGHLRESVINSLHQTGKEGESKDGMDIALCILDCETLEMQYSGANNPLYIIREKVTGDVEDIEEVKADKMPIGIYYSNVLEPFTNVTLKMEKGHSVYIFSDGFPDQFGGPNGKKFKYKPFKELLSANSDKPMLEQHNLLGDAIDEWQSHVNPDSGINYEQVDDIIVIGFRV